MEERSTENRECLGEHLREYHKERLGECVEEWFNEGLNERLGECLWECHRENRGKWRTLR